MKPVQIYTGFIFCTFHEYPQHMFWLRNKINNVNLHFLIERPEVLWQTVKTPIKWQHFIGDCTVC